MVEGGTGLMSLSRLDIYSNVLGMEQTVYVVMPDKGELAPAEPLPPEAGYPVLYLLHGTSHDCSHWLRYTGIERYSTDRKVAVVMPSAQLSGYADMVHGEAFFKYLTDELPEIICRLYKVSRRREDTFVAGVSMGGYGAAKIGLTYPERYAAIGAISNGNHAYMRPIGLHARNSAEAFPSAVMDARHLLCWGIGPEGDPRETQEDLYWLANRALEKGGPLPALFHTCGSVDRNLMMSQHMRDFFRSLPGDPFHYCYYEEPYGEHIWEYWDKWIQIFMAWLPVYLPTSELPL